MFFKKGFFACCNAAGHNSICKYRPKTSKNISTRKLCLGTPTRHSSALTNLNCDIEQELIGYDLGVASSRNSQKNIDFGMYLNCETNELNVKHLFAAAELLLKFSIHGNL